MQLEFDYDDSGNSVTTGTVALISHVSDSSGSSDASYKVYINFTPTEETRLGMTVIVSKPEVAEATDAQTDTADTANQTTPEPDATAEPAVSNVTEAAE